MIWMLDGDSLWIHLGDRVGDVCQDETGNTAINFQNNDHNCKRRLYVTRRLLPFSLIPMAVSPVDRNHLLQNKYRVPDDYIDIFTSQGILEELKLNKNKNGQFFAMLIQVVPDKLENVFDSFKLKGFISIIDPLGNNLIMKKKMAWYDEKKSLIFAWNLKNENTRLVENSPYLCLIEIEETTDSAENTRLKEVKKLLVDIHSSLGSK